jgi:hypothetical protein
VREVPFVLDDVRVVRETDLGWTCDIGGRTVFVGRLQTVPGTTVPSVGERGRLTLSASAARDLGLVDLATAAQGGAARGQEPPRRKR